MNLIQVLRQAGFRGDALRTAWAIAMRESSGRPRAYNGNTGTGDQSYGLFQINMLGDMGPSRRKQYGLRSNEDLFDPLTNAKVAYRMSNGGTDFGAWGIGPHAYKHTTIAPQLAQFPRGGQNLRLDTAATGVKNHVLARTAPTMTNQVADVGAVIERNLKRFGQYAHQSSTNFEHMLQAQRKALMNGEFAPFHSDPIAFPQMENPLAATKAARQQTVKDLVSELPNAKPGAYKGAVQPLPNAKPGDWKKWVSFDSNADRAGVHTNPMVPAFVSKIAQVYGQHLTIGTGTNHREYVAGTNRVSDHWSGDAADIPMTGRQLTRLGQDALIAAGADPKWARQQTGGVYNINGYNILFNTNVGGNHYNHLHVGLGRRKGSNRSRGVL